MTQRDRMAGTEDRAASSLIVDAVLQRIEALPGDGRYAVTFRRPDGSEQTAVMHLRDSPGAGAAGAGVDVAEASLPAGWTRTSEQFALTADAVMAFASARHAAVGSAMLSDVAGGWDVSLGNVVLNADGVPHCTAHGAMTDTETTWLCTDCGAQAVLG